MDLKLLVLLSKFYIFSEKWLNTANTVRVETMIHTNEAGLGARDESFGAWAWGGWKD